MDAPHVADDAGEVLPLDFHRHLLARPGLQSCLEAQPLQEGIQAFAGAADAQEEGGHLPAHRLQDFHGDGDGGAVVQHDDLEETSRGPVGEAAQVTPLAAEAEAARGEVLAAVGTALRQDVVAVPIPDQRREAHCRCPELREIGESRQG